MKPSASNLDHYFMWMEQQRAYLNAKGKFSQRDAEILSHAYVRNFPNKLYLILAELLMEKETDPPPIKGQPL